MHKLFVPSQAVGASAVYWDLFNASGSNSIVTLEAVIPVVMNSVAVVGTLGVDLYLTRTSAVGTGGTAATNEGSSLSAATITALDNSQPLNALITARLTPSGGATAGAVLSVRSVSTEETNAGSYIEVSDMVRYGMSNLPAIIIPANTGVRVVQGSVASVGNIAFEVYFNVVSR